MNLFRVTRLSFLIAFHCLCNLSSVRAQSVEQMMDQGWDLLQRANAPEAESRFKNVLAQDTKNERAAIALSYLYSWQHRYKEAWAMYEQAMENSSHADALMYAAMATSMVANNSDRADNRVLRQFKKYISHPDSMGIVSAMSHSRLGDQLRFTGHISDSQDHYAALNSIDDWNLIGPFENISGSGYNKEYGPEKSIDLSAEYPARFGSTARWFVPLHHRIDRWFDLERHFTSSDGVFYALCFVHSDKKQQASLRVGTSGAFKIYLNDELMLSREDEYNNDIDTYICQTELQAGWNKVLLKMCVWDLNRNNFLVRIVDEKGQALPGLKMSTDLQSYSAKPQALRKLNTNPFESYFEQMVAAHPDQPEYQLLLADCYLRNDRGEEAEITLRNALRRAPNSVILLDRMMEAYSRNDKRDLVVSTLEKIWSIDSSDISALEFKYHEALNNKNIDEATRLFESFVKVCPQEENIISGRLQLLNASGKDNEVIETIRQAYEKFPLNYGFAAGMATILRQDKHDFSAAADVWERYLRENYTYDALSNLAELKAMQNNFSGWEKLRQEIAVLGNDAPGFSFSDARSYFKLEMYDKAEAKVLKALECCPSAGDYLELLGDIRDKQNRKDDALRLYKKALDCYPGYLKLREKIRGLENKKQILSQFSKFSIDSLVKTAPTAQSLPDDESVVVLDDSKYVIYPEGTTEEHFELLVRILKQEGIDEWKELNLGSSAVIEKAVSMKSNGTEIRADLNKGEMVFKGLQEGDFVYVRYRDYVRSTDRFFKHFTERRFFNGKYPTRISRLSVLAPSTYEMKYRSMNENIEPTIRSCDDGKIYEWRLDNQPAMRVEASMPHSDVIAKYVEISSIASWQFIADWYCDVTNRKSRATYEIKEKMEELAPAAAKLSDEEVVRRVYQFITDSVRYSYVPFRQSGGTPQRARDVFITRIGDCKDVATLGISMLSCAGIQADYCLVKTNSALMPDELPSQEFDHVIARVHLKSGLKYLDFTASNFPVGSLPSSDVDAFSLLIQRDVKQAQRLSDSLLLPNVYQAKVVGSLNEEGDLHLIRKSSNSAGLGALMRYAFRNKGKKESEKTIVEDLSHTFPNVRLKNLRFSNLDSLSNEVVTDEELEAPKYSAEAGSFRIFKFPWFRQLNLEQEFSYDSREYPIDIHRLTDTCREEISIQLPPELEPVELPKDLAKSCPLGEYSIRYRFADRMIKAERQFVYKSNTVSVSAYKEVREFVNSIAKEDTRQILLGAAQPKTKKAQKK